MLSIINVVFASLPDSNHKIQELWGCQEEPNGDGGPYTQNVNPIFDTNTTAGWVKVAMILYNPTIFCIIYCGQQANGTAGAQTPLCGGYSYLSLHDILPLPANDMINNIREKLDVGTETRRPNPRSFPTTTKTEFQKSEWYLQRRIIRNQRYLQVI
jgi:hypothetical protein